MTGSVSPLKAGLTSRCPACGEGPLFEGLLSFRQSCFNCDADFQIEDAGDGPAFFVIMLVGFIIVPLALATQLTLNPPIWAQIAIWTPASLALCIYLLRPFRALMFALQWHNNAREAAFAPDPADKDVI